MGNTRGIQGEYIGEYKGNTLGNTSGGYYAVYTVDFYYRFLIILPVSELPLYKVDYTVEWMSRYIGCIGLDYRVQWGRYKGVMG